MKSQSPEQPNKMPFKRLAGRKSTKICFPSLPISYSVEGDISAVYSRAFTNLPAQKAVLKKKKKKAVGQSENAITNKMSSPLLHR